MKIYVNVDQIIIVWINQNQEDYRVGNIVQKPASRFFKDDHIAMDKTGDTCFCMELKSPASSADLLQMYIHFSSLVRSPYLLQK